jgi:DNA-directed RNA polymerase specialized sigma24 family protein
MRGMSDDSLYQEIPNKIDEDLLEQRVQALRDGDKDQIKPIIVSLMRWTIGIARRYHSPNHGEVVSKALLELTKGVTSAQNKLTDNNIKKYLSLRISRRLQDFVADDKVFKIPSTSSTIRKRKKAGKTIRMPKEEWMPLNGCAPREYPTLEFKEALSLLPKNNREKEFIELRLQGLDTEDISQQWQLSLSLVNKLKYNLHKRFIKALGKEKD